MNCPSDTMTSEFTNNAELMRFDILFDCCTNIANMSTRTRLSNTFIQCGLCNRQKE